MPRRPKLYLLIALALGVVLASLLWTRFSWPLAVGAKAPELVGARWLQGEPVDPRHPGGNVIVVECWATWCAPCLASVPRLDALQRRYRDRGLRVGAVAVWDRLADVEGFVARRGAALSYAIAFDESGQVGKRWRASWLAAGVPRAWVVDRDGTIAWSGHPLGGLDEVVAEVLAGTWDRAAFAALEELGPAAWKAHEAGERARLAEVATELIALAPALASGHVWRVRATQDGPTRVRAECHALSALEGRPVQLASFVESLAHLDLLRECADAAATALTRAARAARGDPDLGVRVATLLTAQAAGDAQGLAAAGDAALAELGERPHDLAQLAERLAVARRPGAGESRPSSTAPDGVLAMALRAAERASASLATAHLARLRFDLLVLIAADREGCVAAGREVVARSAGDALALNGFAWSLLVAPETQGRFADLALEAATEMTRCEGWDVPDHLDTLARARFETGDVDGAIALEEKAIEKLGVENASLTAALARYRDARAASRPKR